MVRLECTAHASDDLRRPIGKRTVSGRERLPAGDASNELARVLFLNHLFATRYSLRTTDLRMPRRSPQGRNTTSVYPKMRWSMSSRALPRFSTARCSRRLPWRANYMPSTQSTRITARMTDGAFARSRICSAEMAMVGASSALATYRHCLAIGCADSLPMTERTWNPRWRWKAQTPLGAMQGWNFVVASWSGGRRTTARTVCT